MLNPVSVPVINAAKVNPRVEFWMPVSIEMLLHSAQDRFAARETPKPIRSRAIFKRHQPGAHDAKVLNKELPVSGHGGDDDQQEQSASQFGQPALDTVCKPRCKPADRDADGDGQGRDQEHGNRQPSDRHFGRVLTHEMRDGPGG